MGNFEDFFEKADLPDFEPKEFLEIKDWEGFGMMTQEEREAMRKFELERLKKELDELQKLF